MVSNYLRSICKNSPGGDFRLLRSMLIVTVLCLSLLHLAQYLWSVRNMKEAALQLARAAAESNYRKDFAYRKWASVHGGVYVPVTNSVTPNPYLKVENRDIVTMTGMKLTLINPAKMTREVRALLEHDDMESHVNITSLNLLNPNNAPDEWERKALLALSKGAVEVSGLSPLSGKMHLRLMRPMFIEKGCLKCHTEQGYKIGDLRGGLCVSVPFDLYLNVVKKNSSINLIWHLSAWLAMMIVLVLMYIVLKKSFECRNSAEMESIDLNRQLAARLNELHEENLKLEQAKADREKLESRLLQAQKMEAIGTLAGGIAHDFNNILSAIFGYTGLSMIGISPDSELGKNLEQVLRACERAKDLVKQILCFSRQNKGKLMPLQLSVNIKEILKMIRASLPVTIEIVQDVNNEPSYVFADPTQIHQIVVNLCTNAYHSMEKTGGKLTVSLKKVVFREIDLEKSPDAKIGEYLQLSVCDTGGGIDPSARERIFEPYFTTKGVGEGTGMGLAIVHGIVANYGGFINVYSNLGEGTSFNVFLPVWRGEEPEKLKAVEVPRVGNESILFVDDEPSIAEVGSRILKELGYDVMSTTSSYSALEIFEQDPNSFDLVITDQTMPKLTGYQLAEKMIKIRPDIPIIVCTGFSSIVDEEMAKKIGIKKFVLKPMTTLDISNVIRKVLDDDKKDKSL